MWCRLQSISKKLLKKKRTDWLTMHSCCSWYESVWHCVKYARIRVFFAQHFDTFAQCDFRGRRIIQTMPNQQGMLVNGSIVLLSL